MHGNVALWLRPLSTRRKKTVAGSAAHNGIKKVKRAVTATAPAKTRRAPNRCGWAWGSGQSAVVASTVLYRRHRRRWRRRRCCIDGIGGGGGVSGHRRWRGASALTALTKARNELGMLPIRYCERAMAGWVDGLGWSVGVCAYWPSFARWLHSKGEWRLAHEGRCLLGVVRGFGTRWCSRLAPTKNALSTKPLQPSGQSYFSGMSTIATLRF